VSAESSAKLLIAFRLAWMLPMCVSRVESLEKRGHMPLWKSKIERWEGIEAQLTLDRQAAELLFCAVSYNVAKSCSSSKQVKN